MKRLIFLFVFASAIFYCQNTTVPFYPSNDSLNHHSGEMLAVSNTEFLSLLPKNNGTGKVSCVFLRSTDGGTTWGTPLTLFDTTVTTLAIEDSLATPFLLKVDNGRLLAIFRVGTGQYKYRWSDNNGITWSPPLKLSLWANSAIESTMKITSAVYAGGSNIVLGISQSQNSVGFSKSTDNGVSFTQYQMLTNGGITNPTLLSSGGGDLLMAVQEKNLNNTKLLLMKYSAGTGQWHDTTVILQENDFVRNPKIYREQNGTIHIIYKRVKYGIGGFRNSDLFRISSADGGQTWGTPVQLTKFAGEDTNPNVNPQSTVPLVIFSSYRQMPDRKIHLWWGNFLSLSDDDAPPALYTAKMIPATPAIGDSVYFSVYAGYHKSGLTGTIKGTMNGQNVEFPLYDDGLHNDSTAGDGIFRGLAKIAAQGDFAQLFVEITGGGNHLTTEPFFWSILFDDIFPRTALYTGRIWVPFDRNGVIADVSVAGRSGLWFDSVSTIFSNGFALSALKDGTVWGAANMSASRIDDFVTGPVGSQSVDPRNGIYRVALADSAFGRSWQIWKYAVELGARYWDGNNNGIYDPIDLNHNGIWEPNEDMPEILGEISFWCVYNDGVPGTSRRYPMDPLGIEVRQTVYAFPNSPSAETRNAVFVRYEIVNRGTVVQTLPEAYYSIWSDTDMGEYTDDMFGTDTLRNSIYFYNDGSDGSFGVNPPAVYQTVLFGQPVYVPGVSFTDVNSNGIYDPGIDIPLDTARVPMGRPFDDKLLPGAMNFGSTSSQHYLASHPTHGDPQTVEELRHYQQGRQKNGLIIDPCTWPYGQVYADSCAKIPGRFLYSGDPVTQKGWLTNTPTDQRGMVNSGPFSMNSGDLVTFHSAIVIGRGNDHLNSITVTRAAVDTIFSRFGAKYHFYPTGINEVEDMLPGVYRLYQNYPNPFNPETVIRYTLPARPFGVAGQVNISVYNTLGQLVKVLVNTNMPAGDHEVKFNASGLPSGVYLYRITCAGFSAVRKMVVLK